MGELVKKLIICLFRLLPMKNEILLESYPDFSDNTYALYQYFLKEGVNEKYKIHWALHSEEVSIPELPKYVDTFYLDASGFKNMWKRFSVLYRSKFIIDCNSFIKKRRRGQVRLHLGHGMLIKVTEGYHNAEKIGECDNYLVTSPYWFEVFENKVGLNRECLLPLGYPRNDVLVDGSKRENSFGKYLVWMPTFRQHKSNNSISLSSRYPYGMPEVMNGEQLKKLDDYLGENNFKLYFRPHPAQKLDSLIKEEMKHIIVADDSFLGQHKIRLYELLAAAQALITDYSSVYFDFLLTEKPIGLTVGDREEYFSVYGCAFSDITKELQGDFIESHEELMTFIKAVVENRNMDMTQYKLAKDTFHAVCDGTSAKQIYEYLQENYNF